MFMTAMTTTVCLPPMSMVAVHAAGEPIPENSAPIAITMDSCVADEVQADAIVNNPQMVSDKIAVPLRLAHWLPVARKSQSTISPPAMLPMTTAIRGKLFSRPASALLMP